MNDRTLARIQAVSGLVFAVFLVIHLAAALTATLGQSAFDAWISAARGYYQLPVVEVVGVIGAAVVHALCGLLRAWRRPKARAVPWRLRLHRYAGYFMMLAFTGHVAATRVVPWLYDMTADFTLVHWSLTTLPGFFYPYYVLLALSGALHLGHGVVAAGRRLGVRLPSALTSVRSRAFWAYVGAWAVLAVLVVLAFGGQLFHVDAARVPEWQAVVEGWMD